jgi:signal transduction histidine kinase
MAAFKSIRTWLATTLVCASVLTASVIALYIVPTVDRQYRSLAQDAVLGVSSRAAHQVRHASSAAEIQQALTRASRDGQISIWLVDRNHKVVAASALPSLDLHRLPDESRAVSLALAGQRFAASGDSNAAHVIAMPTRTAKGVREALVAYAPRTGFVTRASDAMHRGLFLGACLAVILAVIASLAVASVVTRRVRRLAGAASRIAAGDFTSSVRDGFPDEIGLLAGSIDEMRMRLAVAFTTLERERESLAGVLDRLEEGVVALDSEGLVEVFNPAAIELLGVHLERGQALPDPWPAHAVEEAARASGAETVEVETPQGRFLRVQRSPFQSDAAADGASLVVVSDRTADRAREETERRFVENASHELRTPLSAIVAAVEVLQDGAKDEPAARDAFLADLQHEAQRLQRLTEGLLTLARLGAGELLPTTLDIPLRPRLVHVAEIMRPLADAAGVTIDVQGTGRATADPDVLDQVLVGLLGNALKHSHSGGSIVLTAGVRDDRACIGVSDTGGGIPPDQLARVFDRFWRGDWARPAGGFGLGLGICREYVEAMGGEISLQSSPGEGTTVEITLPRARREIMVEA